MHPPLDRPHPMCQDEINGLRDCHATGNKLKFWACNEVKAKLDKCFKEEKDEMLKKMNANLDEKKKEEQAQAALAFGRKETFQEYLAKDSTYAREVEKERKKQNSWFSYF
mmetsp:Transcript_13191/g.27913  ORF Transcript_13191/g.27913 Transcript_13191/m.27913 type:complete len:110 (-) Transcript_13191:1208-1537(-)